jgi:hypothetical protein
MAKKRRMRTSISFYSPNPEGKTVYKIIVGGHEPLLFEKKIIYVESMAYEGLLRTEQNQGSTGIAMLSGVVFIVAILMFLSVVLVPLQALATTTTGITRDPSTIRNMELLKSNYEKWDKMAWHYNTTNSEEQNLLSLQEWWCNETASYPDSPVKSDVYCQSPPPADFSDLMMFYANYGDAIILKTAWSHSSSSSAFQYEISEHNIREWIFTSYQAAVASQTKTDQ